MRIQLSSFVNSPGDETDVLRHLPHLPKHEAVYETDRVHVPRSKEIHNRIQQLLGYRPQREGLKVPRQLQYATRYEEPIALEEPTREVVLLTEALQAEELDARYANPRGAGHASSAVVDAVLPTPEDLHLREVFHPPALQAPRVVPLLAIGGLDELHAAILIARDHRAYRARPNSTVHGHDVVGHAHLAHPQRVRPLRFTPASALGAGKGRGTGGETRVLPKHMHVRIPSLGL